MCALIKKFGNVLRKWDHFQSTGQNGKKCKIENFNLFSNNCLLKKAYPKFLKIIQETNFDQGFQKINIGDRYKKGEFFF